MFVTHNEMKDFFQSLTLTQTQHLLKGDFNPFPGGHHPNIKKSRLLFNQINIDFYLDLRQPSDKIIFWNQKFLSLLDFFLKSKRFFSADQQTQLDNFKSYNANAPCHFDPLFTKTFDDFLAGDTLSTYSKKVCDHFDFRFEMQSEGSRVEIIAFWQFQGQEEKMIYTLDEVKKSKELDVGNLSRVDAHLGAMRHLLPYPNFFLENLPQSEHNLFVFKGFVGMAALDFYRTTKNYQFKKTFNSSYLNFLSN